MSGVSERHAAHPLLGELEELIESRDSAPRSERLIHFARALLGRTLHERLRTFDLEELYRQTTELYDFADARGRSPIAVRIIDSPPAGTALELNVPDAPFLVDTVRAAVQGAGHRVRLLCTRSSASSATPRGTSSASRMRANPAVASRSCGWSSTGR